jgi:uncharacterized protein
MKYIVIILVVLAVLWLLRSQRRGKERDVESRKDPTLTQPQDMVRCPVCAVHLPRADALPGPDGRLYCCAAHRPRGES